jgi:hypothetical protein
MFLIWIRCTAGQLAIILELVAIAASEQAREMAQFVSRMSIKVLWTCCHCGMSQKKEL